MHPTLNVYNLGTVYKAARRSDYHRTRIRVRVTILKIHHRKWIRVYLGHDCTRKTTTRVGHCRAVSGTLFTKEFCNKYVILEMVWIIMFVTFKCQVSGIVYKRFVKWVGFLEKMIYNHLFKNMKILLYLIINNSN